MCHVDMTDKFAIVKMWLFTMATFSQWRPCPPCPHMITDPVLADSSFDDAPVTEIYMEVQHRNQDETMLLAGDEEDELKLLVDSITAAIDQKFGQGYCALDDVAAAKQIVVFGL